MKENQLAKYQKYYSEAGLTDKLKRVAKKAGLKTVYATLLLYYVLLSKQVSVKEKTLIIGALGYLILPLDLIPDAIPLTGFADDFTALLTAIHAIECISRPKWSSKLGSNCKHGSPLSMKKRLKRYSNKLRRSN